MVVNPLYSAYDMAMYIITIATYRVYTICLF